MKRKKNTKPPTGELVVKVINSFSELDERNQAVVEGFIYGLLTAVQQKAS